MSLKNGDIVHLQHLFKIDINYLLKFELFNFKTKVQVSSTLNMKYMVSIIISGSQFS